MKFPALIGFLFSLLAPAFASEAGEGINSDIYFNKKIRIDQNARFVVLPFELTVPWAQKPEEEAAKKNIENRNTEKFEISLLEAGVTVVERNKLDRVLSEQVLSKSGLTESDSIRIGKMLSADIVVMGTISMWQYYEKTNKGVIEILIKGVVVETGEIIFKAVFDSKIDTTFHDFKYDMGRLETRAYKILGEKIKNTVDMK